MKMFYVVFTFPFDVFMLLSYLKSEILISLYFLGQKRTRNIRAIMEASSNRQQDSLVVEQFQKG